jgi:hypothetical protein
MCLAQGLQPKIPAAGAVEGALVLRAVIHLLPSTDFVICALHKACSRRFLLLQLCSALVSQYTRLAMYIEEAIYNSIFFPSYALAASSAVSKVSSHL